ncbi:DUF6527 family protein [Flavobacterium rakeshii]|uniref:DUF6527 family protein n=1 Tax=Flavobacterium rakeshii TaxID=1038845 RepID=UPI002E7BF725|nr:DUF6527 family protein [Flavobacterium rakeshii]MEE1899560.1 DUF6527 family protein [Flavobacterium rakeshii]
MPEAIDDGYLYVSLNYGTIIHNCACGCGNQVNTPLSPTGWKIIYDGDVISLEPSIGNWSFKCKSHYWITNGRIQWASTWNQEKIDKIRKIEEEVKDNFYKAYEDASLESFANQNDITTDSNLQKGSLLSRLFNRVLMLFRK